MLIRWFMDDCYCAFKKPNSLIKENYPKRK